MTSTSDPIVGPKEKEDNNITELIGNDLDLSNLIQQYNVKIFNKSLDQYEIINEVLQFNHSEASFNIVDITKIISQFRRWKEHMPRIEIFYAIKANSCPLIIQLLASLGCNFDCASKNEIATVIGITNDPSRIIYANPVKMVEQIRYSRANDVDLMTFDSVTELYKIKLYHPYANLVMRIKVKDTNSMCKFSDKFGCTLEEAVELCSVAKTLKLIIVGVSFHVGSGCMDATQYREAIIDARKVFDIAKTQFDIPMSILDIGGGFCNETQEDKYPPFEEIAKIVTATIDTEFKDIERLRVIAEPGRFISSSSYTLVLSIIGKKEKMIDNKKGFSYYLSDGIYSSFNNIIFDYYKPEVIPFNERNEQVYPSELWGPTCDSMDCICKTIELPELCVGEYLFTQNMGAYSQSSASASFNGFTIAPNVYIMTC